MRARPAGLIALLALALFTSSACGGGEERVLTTREYADAVIAARQQSDEEIEGLIAEFATEIEAIQARLEKGVGELEENLTEADSASDTFAELGPLTEDFAEAVLDSLAALIRSAAGVVEEHVAHLNRLEVPAHVSEHHESLASAFEAFHRRLEGLASDLGTIERQFATMDEFEAFAEEFTQLSNDWDLGLLDDKTDAACSDLEEALEGELGTRVEICG